MVTAKSIQSELQKPFDSQDIKFRVGATTTSDQGSRGQALPYVDARAIQDRLDEVMGVDGWQTRFTAHVCGAVECRLSLKINGKWVTKADVGSPSDQKDVGDRAKTAYSDALKRAAVQWGVGRYLYRIKPQWVALNGKRFAVEPKLPVEPQSQNKAPAKASQAPASAPPAASPQVATQASQPAASGAKKMPASGAEMLERLQTHEKKLVVEKVCQPGDLIAWVRDGGKQKYGNNLDQWDAPEAIQLAVDRATEFGKKWQKGSQMNTHKNPGSTGSGTSRSAGEKTSSRGDQN